MDSAFLGLFSTSCGPSFSGHGYATQSAANTSCPRSDRFWLRELRVSQQISTFYGPSVQTMDAQLGARQRGWSPTIHRGREGRARRYATRHHPRTLDPEESERPWTLSSAVAGSRYSPCASM